MLNAPELLHTSLPTFQLNSQLGDTNYTDHSWIHAPKVKHKRPSHLLITTTFWQPTTILQPQITLTLNTSLTNNSTAAMKMLFSLSTTDSWKWLLVCCVQWKNPSNQNSPITISHCEQPNIIIQTQTTISQLNLYLASFCYLTPRAMQSFTISVSVCLSVHISQKLQVQTSQNFLYASGSVLLSLTICYVLPALWTMLCFHIMG